MRFGLIVGSFLVGAIVAGPAPVGAVPIPLQSAAATFSQTGFPVSQAIDGSLSTPITFNGWAIDPNGGTSQTAVFETGADVSTPGGTWFQLTLDHTFYNPLGAPTAADSEHALGRFRLSVTNSNRVTFADQSINLVEGTAVWTVLDPLTFTSQNLQTITEQVDNSLLVTENDTLNDVYTIRAFTTLQNITGFRLDVLTDPTLPNNGPGLQDSNGNFVLSEFTVEAVPEPTTLLMWGTMASGLGFVLRRRRG